MKKITTKRRKIFYIFGLVGFVSVCFFLYFLFAGPEPAFELGPGWTIHKYVPTFDVYKNDKLVAKIKAQSGYLTSTALPPPGTPLKKHPFITASVLVPEEENNLSQLLERAKDFNGYLSLLKEDGYIVFIIHP